MPDQSNRRARNGFTLLEMLVVLVILGLLAGLIGPQLFGRVGEAKGTTAKTQMELLGVALDSYRLDNGSYPLTSQGLDALVARPTRPPAPLNWRGPYLRKAVPADPWGRPYLYQSPARGGSDGFDLRSLGRDGAEGGTGDDADLGGLLPTGKGK
jgi:general secretion pathway protein G